MDDDEQLAQRMLNAWIADDNRALSMQQGRPESPGHLVAPPHLKNFRNDVFVLNNSQSAQEAERIMEMIDQGPALDPNLNVGKRQFWSRLARENKGDLIKAMEGVLR